MGTQPASKELTSSLEDYLETIYDLGRDQRFARVKDIASARGVRPGSVSPAMRRLADLGLVNYHRREFIRLTAEGEEVARRVASRHQALVRLFRDVLGVDARDAEQEACAMEHSLSPGAMDRLVRLLEFLTVCPGGDGFMRAFREYGLEDGAPDCPDPCARADAGARDEGTPQRTVADLGPGQQARVSHVAGRGAVRQRLLDMGILPDVRVEVERISPTGDPIWIRLGGFQVSLGRQEAGSVLIADQ